MGKIQKAVKKVGKTVRNALFATPEEKIELLNQLHARVTDYSISGEEVEYIYVPWDSKTANILVQLGVWTKDLIIDDHGKGNLEVDIAQFAFWYAGWWDQVNGFVLERPKEEVNDEINVP